MKALSALVALLIALGGQAGVAFAAPKPPAARSSKAALHGVVNLNTADEGQLELLPGVGPTKSKRIVEFRKAKPFKKVDDLVRVKGFGRKTLARLKSYLAVSGPTTITDEVIEPK